MNGDEEKEREDEANKQRWIALVRAGDAAREVLNEHWPGEWEDEL